LISNGGTDQCPGEKDQRFGRQRIARARVLVAKEIVDWLDVRRDRAEKRLCRAYDALVELEARS